MFKGQIFWSSTCYGAVDGTQRVPSYTRTSCPSYGTRISIGTFKWASPSDVSSAEQVNERSCLTCIQTWRLLLLDFVNNIFVNIFNPLNFLNTGLHYWPPESKHEFVYLMSMYLLALL